MRYTTLALLACISTPTLAYENVKGDVYIRPSNAQQTLYPDYRPYAPAPTVAQFWSGSRVGAMVITGEAESEGSRATGQQTKLKAKGVGGLVTFGKDWERKGLVFGLEGDVGHRHAEEEGSAFGQTDKLKLGLTGSARARVGMLVHPRVLVYGTGGLAATRAEYETRGGAGSLSQTKTLTGPTYGAGVEVAFNPRTSGRVELRKTDYGSMDVTGPAALARKVEVEDTALMFGLTRKLSY